jgi:uncharacterized protein YecE (DUF72 family)
MERNKGIHIGTSGWHYKHWKGPFYPYGISTDDFLAYYAERFHTVEINNTFYQLPKKETFLTWRDTTPSGFIFSVKASRYITHMKKLKDPQQSLVIFLERVAILTNKLGLVLFQMPPHWSINTGRLIAFLETLPKDYRYAFEFRDTSWFTNETYEALAKHEAAFCIYDLSGLLSPKEVTADFVYIRLHGPESPYQGQYHTNVLSGWAETFSTWSQQGKEIFCYFDNDEAGYAAQDAMRLQEMIGTG